MGVEDTGAAVLVPGSGKLGGGFSHSWQVLGGVVREEEEQG